MAPALARPVQLQLDRRALVATDECKHLLAAVATPVHASVTAAGNACWNVMPSLSHH